MIEEVMGFLISSYWVIGEAEDLNIHLSSHEVRRRFDGIRANQFSRPGEFSKFLRESGQTIPDLLFRVRLNLLSMKIQARILAGRHGETAQQESVSAFVKAFKDKWRAMTYCLPAYTVQGCGHAQSRL